MERFNLGDILLRRPLLLCLLVEYHCVQYITREVELIHDAMIRGVIIAIKETSRLSGPYIRSLTYTLDCCYYFLVLPVKYPYVQYFE